MSAPPPQRRQGSVIVAVLIFVILLSFILVAFMEDAMARIRYSGLFHNRDDLRSQAYSGLEITLAVLAEFREIDQGLHAPSQGWRDPLKFVDFTPEDGVEVTIRRLQDESGKIPLTEQNEDLLLTLFRVLGFDLAEAEELRDRLLDWMDTDDEHRLDGFDGEQYEDLDPGYLPANGPLRTFEELPLIAGFKQAFWDKDGNPLPILEDFKQAVSLYHQGPINLNAANPTVLQVLALQGLIPNTEIVTDFLHGRDGLPNTGDERTLRPDTGAAVLGDDADARLSDSSDTFIVEVEARRGDASFLLTTLVEWQGADLGGGAIGDVDAPPPADQPAAPEAPLPESPTGPGANDRPSRTQRAVGETATATGEAPSLGYPFHVLFLRENRQL